MLLAPGTQEVLVSSQLGDNAGMEQYSLKVRDKLVNAKLNANERKKITSKSKGNWCCMADDNGLIGVVCVQDDYPDRLAYRQINEFSVNLKEICGELYYEKPASEITTAFLPKLQNLNKMYNDPARFDRMMQVNQKVEKAKDAMVDTQNIAMENQNKVERVDLATKDLMGKAKGFQQNSAELQAIIHARNVRLKVIIICAAIGGGGAILQPIIQKFSGAH